LPQETQMEEGDFYRRLRRCTQIKIPRVLNSNLRTSA
jgi:hypothetical protein